MVATAEHPESDEPGSSTPPATPAGSAAEPGASFPHHSDSEIAALFDSIVSHLEPPPASGGPPDHLHPPPHVNPPPPTDWRTHTPPEDSDEFVPPPALELPEHDLGFWASLIGIVCGPILLMYGVLTGSSPSSLPMWGGLLLTLTGFGVLMARLPTTPRDEDDNGAQV